MALLFRKKNRLRKRILSDVNMTPMIDIMLVLLIIFMVAAPMITTGVKVTLPTASAPSINENEKPVVVYVDSNGKTYIGETEVDRETIGIKLRAIVVDTNTKIFVKGDKSLYYGDIMRIMGHISDSGFKKVVLVTGLPKRRNR
jgi:biopolymer transport protein TolR